MVPAIALAVHPANKNPDHETVAQVQIGRSTGVVFKLESGYVPAFQGMACPGYLKTEQNAINWIEAYAEQVAA